MKKFYLMLLGLIVAVAANAADWYLVGSNFGWSDNAKYKFTPDATNPDIQTYYLDSFSGDFKIKPAGSSWSQSFGSNGSKLKEGVSYKAGYDGGNISVDGTISEATITINTKDHTILVTGAQKENEYSVVYLVGDFGSGWNENITNYPLNLKEGTTNVWEGAFTLNAGTTYFKMKAGSYVYGTGGSDIAVVTDKEYTASQSGNAFNLPKGEYTFTFVLDKNADTGTLTVKGKEVLPTSLYVIGVVNNTTWDPRQGIEMTATSEGVFSAKNVEIGEADAIGGFGYFSFAVAIGGTSASDWSVVNSAARYGASEENYTPSFTEPNTIVAAGNPNAFKVVPGAYDMTVDLKNMTLVITEGEVVVPPITVPEKLYISYDLTGEAEGKGWSFNHELTNEGDGIFTSEPFTVTAETGYFTLTSTELTDWNLAEGGIRYGAGDSEVAVEEDKTYDVNPVNDNCWTVAPGTYYITVNFSIDDNTITLTLTRTEMPAKYPELYFRCSDNEWSATDAYKLTCTEGVYTISLPSLYGAFRIGDAAWNDENTATTANMAMAVGETYDTQNLYGGDSDNMAMADGLTNVTVIYDYNNAKIKVEGTVDESATVEFSIFGNFNLFVAEEPALLAENPWNSIAMAQDGEKWSATVVPAAENGEFLITQSRKAVNLAFYKADADATLSTAAEPLTLGADKENNIKYALDPTHKYNLSFVPETGVLSATDEGLTTGIEAIVADGNEAPEYFNLQGVRVAQPEAGNLYIVRRGASVAKVLVK